jgi:hypothetical protein
VSWNRRKFERKGTNALTTNMRDKTRSATMHMDYGATYLLEWWKKK